MVISLNFDFVIKNHGNVIKKLIQNNLKKIKCEISHT